MLQSKFNALAGWHEFRMKKRSEAAIARWIVDLGSGTARTAFDTSPINISGGERERELELLVDSTMRFLMPSLICRRLQLLVHCGW